MKRFGQLVPVVVLAILLALFMYPAAGQETPVPTAEATPPPVVDTTTTTTTTTSVVENIGLTLTWVLAFLALWQAAGIAYAVSIEKTLKPVLYGIVNQFTEDVRVRNALLILAVFIGAFYVVSSGGINLFVDAPFGLLENATPAFLLVLNSVFVAVGAFMGHEIWQTLETWLKKAKAVSDILTPSRAQARRAQTVEDLQRRYDPPNEGVNFDNYGKSYGTKSLPPDTK